MKKLLKIYVRFIQKILISILLTFLYFIIFSLTKLLMLVIANKHFYHTLKTETFWKSAEGYTSEMKSALEQS